MGPILRSDDFARRRFLRLSCGAAAVTVSALTGCAQAPAIDRPDCCLARKKSTITNTSPATQKATITFLAPDWRLLSEYPIAIMNPLAMNALPTHTGTFHSPKGMPANPEVSDQPTDVNTAVRNSRTPQPKARRYPQRSNVGIGSGAVAIP